MNAAALVTVGGFAAIATSTIPAVRVFAVLSAVAVLAALVADLILTPALVLCFAPSGPSGNPSHLVRKRHNKRRRADSPESL